MEHYRIREYALLCLSIKLRFKCGTVERKYQTAFMYTHYCPSVSWSRAHRVRCVRSSVAGRTGAGSCITMGLQSCPVRTAPWVPRALLAPLDWRSAHHQRRRRWERTDEIDRRMFLTRASAVATQSNRPFSTVPRLAARPAGTVRHRIGTSFPLPHPPTTGRQALPSIVRVFGIIIIIIIVVDVVIAFYRTAGARPADTGGPHVTVFAPFVPRGDGRLPFRPQSTVVHELAHTHVIGFACNFCNYHHHCH